MKATIMIPAYNAGKFLVQAIESSLNQTSLEEYEVVAVNDGSTDNTRMILEEYKDKFPDIINIIHQNNQGTGATRNRLLQESRGEYLLGLDADDYLHPKALEEVISFFDLNPNLDVVYTDNKVIDEKGQVIKERKKAGVSQMFNESILHFHFPGHLRAFRKSSIKRGFNPDLKGMSEDYDFLLNIILQKWPEVSVGHIPKSLYFYRVNPNGLNQNKPSRSREVLERKLNEFRIYGNKKVDVIPISFNGLKFWGHKVEGEKEIRTGINEILVNYLKEGLIKV